MIDHISVRAQDLSKVVEFYKAALGPIGYKVLMDYPGATGMGGSSGMPDLWIMQTDKPLNPTHVALGGLRREIDQFHAAALAAGGTDNGAPGLRPDYHQHYYAAYVLDPEGNNIEVVCHYPNGVPPAPPARAAAKRKPAASARKKVAASSAKKLSAKSGKKTAKKAPAKAKGKSKAKRR
jgi:catechol 2,3-dioxygenase-like lactoylglutathione lyase family enzyme